MARPSFGTNVPRLPITRAHTLNRSRSNCDRMLWKNLGTVSARRSLWQKLQEGFVAGACDSNRFFLGHESGAGESDPDVAKLAAAPE